MKQTLISILTIALLVGIAFGITYDSTYYMQHKSWALSGNTSLDPIYLYMDEVESIIEGETGTGVFWYVDASATGQATGKSWEHACVTIDAAIDLSSADGGADRGDRIYVAQGSDETKSATGALFTADIVGMSIIFLGEGDNRAKLTLSHTGAKIDVTANGVRLSNFYLDATGVDSVNTPLNVSGEGCVLDNFFIRLADGAGQADVGITIGVADGDANDLIIANGIIVAPDAGAASAITFAKDMENVTLSNLRIYGDYSTAGTDVPNGAEAQVNLQILNCVVVSKNADEPAIEIYGTGNTGVIHGCTLVSDAEATILDAGGLQVSNTELLVIGNAEGAALPANMTLVDLIGDFTGPDDGAAADDNIKAALDVVIADTEAMDTSAELVALVDPNYVSYDAPRIAIGNYNFTDDTGGQAAYTIFTITGDIMAKCFGVCDVALTGATATIELGVSGNTAVLIAQTTGTDLILHEIWHDASPTTTVEQLDPTAFEFVITNGQDAIFTIGTADLTAGDIDFYLFWVPLSNDAAVVAP